MAATPELANRLKQYVSGGSGSVPGSDDAFIEGCIAEAVALVDNWTNTKYVSGVAPVAPLTLVLPEISASVTVTTLPNYTPATFQLNGSVKGTLTLSRAGDVVRAVVDLTWTMPQKLDLPSHVGVPTYGYDTSAWPVLPEEFAIPLDKSMDGDRTLVSNWYGDTRFDFQAPFQEFTVTPTQHHEVLAWAAVQLPATDLIRVSPVPSEVLERAYVEVGAEFFYRKNAPQGITQFASVDGAAIRTRRDPLEAVRPMLSPYLAGGFA